MAPHVMAQVHSQMLACQFPATCRQAENNKRPLSVRVDLHRHDVLQQALEKGDDGQLFSAIVRTAWALCLRCYTGLDDVCFGYEDLGGPSTAANQRRGQENAGGVSIFRLVSDMTLEEVIGRAHDEDLPIVSKPGDGEYNTTVLLRFGTATGTTQQVTGKSIPMPDRVCPTSELQIAGLTISSVSASPLGESTKVGLERFPRVPKLVLTH